MKKMIFALSFFSLVSAQAMDLKNFRNLGFSSKGHFFAFANSVVQDGSGFPQASVYVVNVPNNMIVRSASLTIDDDSSYEESDALRRVLPQVDLESYNITSGQNLGEDHGLVQQNGHQASFTADNRNFSVNLTELDASNEAQNSSCSNQEQGSKMILVTLSIPSLKQEVTLQRDRRQPASRYCSYDYKIEKVLTHGKNLVVVISYQSPGFEGPDTTHMVVTGTLP